MYYAECPKLRGLPREILKWLQSLDLSFYPNNVRRDFSNGYLVAEMFSHYYPQDFPKHSYDKGTSLTAKQKNWSRIERSLQKLDRQLTKEVVDGTIHCKPGAAELLVNEVYTILTNQRGQYITFTLPYQTDVYILPNMEMIKNIRDAEGPESDFTDHEYQELLPSLARSTACRAIKNNLRTTELMAEPDISTNQRKAEVILHRHLKHKAAERALNPGHFKVKPNVGLLAAKTLVPSSQDGVCFKSPLSGGTTSKFCSSPWTGAAVPFKEIKVRQPVRSSLLND